MAKSSDEIKELQRSINRLQRADGIVLSVGGRVYLVELEAVTDPDVLLDLLTRETVPEAEVVAGLARGGRVREPARAIDGRFLGTLQRDLKVLEKHPDLAALTREAPRLFRGRSIDRAWLAERGARLSQLQEAFARENVLPDPRPRWEVALALARSLYGEAVAGELEGLRARSSQVSAERRLAAEHRIDGVVRRLEGQASPRDAPELAAFLDQAAEKARQAARLPGRARRKRLRQVVAAVLAWPAEPAPPAVEEPEIDLAETLPRQVRTLAAHQIARQGSTRAPDYQERLALCLSRYGLLFPPEPGGALCFDEDLVRRALHRWSAVREALAGLPLRLEQVLGLLAPPHPDPDDFWSPPQLRIVGGWVAGGLEIPLLQEIARRRLLSDLAFRGWDVETVRSYASWVARLEPLYRQEGLRLALSPKAFLRLRSAKREELALLGLCLLEHHAAGADRPTDRQIAFLDATLALFQKLPQRARACLEGLQDVPAGLGASLCAGFAAWLEHDPLLDRYLYLCGRLGLPQVPSKNLLRDFAGAARRSAELDFLKALAEPGEAQRQRIAQLENAAPPPGPAWTLRRLAERSEALARQLLERRIDQALAEVLSQAFGLTLPRITPAWRDVFRFYLSTDDNRELLGVLLRQATAQPGRYFPPALPKNRQWLERAAARMSVEGWLRPRRRAVEIAGWRYTLEVEEDPVEVLRMGIPFRTCLSLADGCNAASTVLNALEVNKRVLYLKDTAGAPVARQLIAVSTGFALLRYNLYSALPTEHGSRLAEEMRALCEEIARDAGLPLGNEGEPENLHGGFWYDDGIEPFAATPAAPLVEAYCRSLGLAPPPLVLARLRTEAELWEAVQTWDVERFARAADDPWRNSLSEIELGERLIAKVGAVEVARRCRQGARHLLPALLRHHAAQGAEAVLRAARPLVRGGQDGDLLYEILRGLPLSPTAMNEVALQATRLAARETSFQEGIEHGTFSLLWPTVGSLGLEQLFELCDRLEPLWARIAAVQPECGECRRSAMGRLIERAGETFQRDPDTRAAIACLRSKRRGEIARQAAVRVLALFPFPRQGGRSLAFPALTALERAPSDAPRARQALLELAARRPAIGRSADLLAALLRQGADVDLDAWSTLEEPPFEALHDLVLHVPALVPWLAACFGVPRTGIADWTPGFWELYVHRRVETPWRRRLEREIEEDGRDAARALQWLARLGEPVRPETPAARGGRKRKTTHAPRQLAAFQAGIAWQLQPEVPGDPFFGWCTPERGEVDATLLRRTLRLLAAERRSLATATEDSHRDLARAFQVLASANLADAWWIAWLGELCAETRGPLPPLLTGAVEPWLRERSPHLLPLLPPDLLLWLWETPALRQPLLGILLHVWAPQDVRRIYLTLRDSARAREIDPRELFEHWIVKLLEKGSYSLVAQTGDRDLLLFAVRTALAHTTPERWLHLYDALPDPLSSALFLGELARQPEARRQEMRALLHEGEEEPEEEGLYRFWLERGLSPSFSNLHAPPWEITIF